MKTALKTVSCWSEINRQEACPECGGELDYDMDGESGIVFEICADACGHQDQVAQMEAIR